MQPESAAFLWDVREAGVRITTFTEGLTGESYAADELRKSAVERQLENSQGEASGHGHPAAERAPIAHKGLRPIVGWD